MDSYFILKQTAKQAARPNFYIETYPISVIGPALSVSSQVAADTERPKRADRARVTNMRVCLAKQASNIQA